MLAGKVVVITGSGGGIGRYVAKTYAQAGAKVVVADVKPLDRVAADLGAIEADYLGVPTDVRDDAAVRNLMERAVERFGRIDVLHNNAAIVPHVSRHDPRWTRIAGLDLDLWNSVIQTNLGGTFLCTRHALPYMEAHRSGHVISTMGGSRRVGAAPYQVSKDAIRSFTRAVADEEREFNVCVVTMSPGGRIAVEGTDPETLANFPGPEAVGNRFVLAAEAGMELSGQLIDVQDGKLIARQ
jgi:NAD(P)-dependent dehydrogenase (short-subunit alcohol dehydrogenase family)